MSGLDLESVYEEHGQFVWLTLQRLGVHGADAEDLLQEVFVVVHHRLRDFDPTRARITTWLYGICFHVVRSDRRRAFRRRERGDALTSEHEGKDADRPDVNAEAAEARVELATLLDTLDLDKRVVLVMYEIEEMSCDRIAETLGVPVGTVYSRLHAARRELARAAQRARPAARVQRGAAGP